jgi:hypothetical protein
MATTVKRENIMIHLTTANLRVVMTSGVGGCIQKFPNGVDNEIHINRHSLRSNTKGYGGKTHYTDSQTSDTTAPSGRELYRLKFLLQAASSETFGYTLVQKFPRDHCHEFSKKNFRLLT